MREKIQTLYWEQSSVARSRTKSSEVECSFLREGNHNISRKDPQVTEKDHEMVKAVCRSGRQPFQRWQSAGIRLSTDCNPQRQIHSKDDRHKSALPLLVQKTINHRRSQNCKSCWWFIWCETKRECMTVCLWLLCPSDWRGVYRKDAFVPTH